MKSFALAAIGIAVFNVAAVAQTLPKPQDYVIVPLQQEGWVTTQSANVGVFFNITQQQESASELKRQILASLAKLSANAPWHITSTRVNKDNTGLNRWYVAATARVSEASVSGLQDRAEAASRSGFKVTIGRVDFSPTLAETNALMAGLRAKIYEDAAQEAARLSKVISGAKYHVQMVDFLKTGSGHPRPMVQAMRSKNMAVQEMSSNTRGNTSASTQMPISRKHNLSATVTLSRISE